jgi:cold shock CspA family protein
MDPDVAAQRGFDRQDYDLGHKILEVDGEHDVFGECLPTYGHTPGHQSLKLRLPTGEIANAMKGFGFIASDRGGKDIFVHASALERAGITGLAEGQRVAVDVIDGRKGPEAASLRLI